MIGNDVLNGFLYMMNQIFRFLRYPFNIGGFTFSIMEAWFYAMFCGLMLNFVWQLFGRENVHNE